MTYHIGKDSNNVGYLEARNVSHVGVEEPLRVEVEAC
jgi:hypothetical protein